MIFAHEIELHFKKFLLFGGFWTHQSRRIIIWYC